MPVHPSICRFCHAHCGILVEVQGGRAVRVTGDVANPVYQGFACAKGRALPQQHAHPDRLLRSVKRMPDGTHQPIESERAMDEIAERVRAIVERHGPRAVALYLGTYSFPYAASSPVAVSWMLGIGSRMIFTSNTIDQPGKPIAAALHGRWNAGAYGFDEADAWMLVGANPLVAMSNGIPNANPPKRLAAARRRGLRLIVIDPRRSECARHAHVHLQPRPGEDPTILAGMIRCILAEGLHDAAFAEQHVAGVGALREAVEPFTPDYVERRADVAAAELLRAARCFAAARRAGANAGTGPNMAGRGNLTEYLLLALMSVCGQWRRAGERFPNPFALLPPYAPRAQAEPPQRAWGFGEKLRVRGFTDAACGLPTAALADEILLPGEGQVRALFNLGGNPLSAWPDQRKTHAALRTLELNVTLDVKMSATAKLAHYVIAPRLSLEVPGMTLPNESLWFYGVGLGYPAPYAQYAPALLDPPPGSDLLEEWELFYGLGQRMGVPLRLRVGNIWNPGATRPERVSLDMERKPSTDELFEILTRGARVPLSEVKRHPHGAVFPGEPVVVAPPAPEREARLQVGDPVMLAELREVAREPIRRDTDYPYRLIGRRMPGVYNSSGRDIPKLTRRYSYNPAFMNPEDLERLGLRAGDLVEIRSDHDSILGVVEAAPDVRSGVVSMSHCFGDGLDDARVRSVGSNTGRLTSVERDYDPYSGIPRMSAIPVDVRRAERA